MVEHPLVETQRRRKALKKVTPRLGARKFYLELQIISAGSFAGPLPAGDGAYLPSI